MKRLIAVLALIVFSALPAQAHHADIDAFFDAGPYDAALWNESVNEEICYSTEFKNHQNPDYRLTNFQANNLVDAVWEGYVGQWRNRTDFNKTINFGNDGVEECQGNWSFRIAYENAEIGKSFGESVREDFCEHRPSDQASTLQYEDLSWLNPDYLALTWTCDTDNNGLTDYVVTVVDPKANWHWAPYSATGSNEWDFPSVIAHESGHGIGFAKHWADDSETCPNTFSGHNTMCNDSYGLFSGSAPDRDLASHDIGEANQAY